jgi:hypothetical protein
VACYTLCVTPLPMDYLLLIIMYAVYGDFRTDTECTLMWVLMLCQNTPLLRGRACLHLPCCDTVTETSVLWMCSWFFKFLIICQNTPLLRGRACLHLPCCVTQKRVGIPRVILPQPSAQHSNFDHACKACETGLTLVAIVSLIFMYLNFAVYVGHSKSNPSVQVSCISGVTLRR